MKKRILIFPAGTEISFEILNALKYSKFVEIFGGTSVDDHSEFRFKNLIKSFPFVSDESFLPYLNKVIEEYKIDCIYPAHDSVSVFLSKNRDAINAQSIIADAQTTTICRSKKETYALLCGEPFVPRVFQNGSEIDEYPVFVKPDVGQGSVGAKLIHNKDELSVAMHEDDSIVICEYLPNEEYTVDCFTDRHGMLRVAKPRKRERIKSGISVRTGTVLKTSEENNRLTRIAEIINKKLKFRGAWFFQVRKDRKGEFKLLEISPRIPGTMGLSRNCGINFPMLTLFDFWECDISILENSYHILVDRAFYNAYRIDFQYEHVYLDFDDTLIVNEKLNLQLLRFLYQCVDEGKRIHLLTKHVGDLKHEFKRFRISEELFDEITVIGAHEQKTDYIKYTSAVFVDDSFAERKKVSERLSIPVFDVDMVESLLDWRM